MKTPARRVLVCGGRDFSDYVSLRRVLDQLHKEHYFACVIEGGARGADTWAKYWANARNIPVKEYKADWNSLGPAAGPIRNQQMLDEASPDLVVAFPGGRGTADMVRRASIARIILIEYEWRGATLAVKPSGILI